MSNPTPCYFAISQADQQRMHNYAAGEIGRLTALANGRADGIGDSSTARMVTALLSSQVNEKLEPLRATPEPGAGPVQRRRLQLARLHLLQMEPGRILAPA